MLLEKPLDFMSIRYNGRYLSILDQTLLPNKEFWVEIETLEAACEAILELRIRGAPLIGVFASCYIDLLASKATSCRDLREAINRLKSTRPTAVNLFWAMGALESSLAEDSSQSQDAIRKTFITICQKELSSTYNIAKHSLFLADRFHSNKVLNIVTYCNTGGLATIGKGTALAAIEAIHQTRLNVHVFVCETRPLLQGARLTTWELGKLGIDHTLICDSMIASLFTHKQIDFAITGADRIAANGDFANKIGTNSLALLSKHFNIPFYVAAPRTTIDFSCNSGKDIQIETRDSLEITKPLFGTSRLTPISTKVWNPAFDVSDGSLVEKYILDTGVYKTGDIEYLQHKKKVRKNCNECS